MPLNPPRLPARCQPARSAVVARSFDCRATHSLTATRSIRAVVAARSDRHDSHAIPEHADQEVTRVEPIASRTPNSRVCAAVRARAREQAEVRPDERRVPEKVRSSSNWLNVHRRWSVPLHFGQHAASGVVRVPGERSPPVERCRLEPDAVSTRPFRWGRRVSARAEGRCQSQLRLWWSFGGGGFCFFPLKPPTRQIRRRQPRPVWWVGGRDRPAELAECVAQNVAPMGPFLIHNIPWSSATRSNRVSTPSCWRIVITRLPP